jgi:PAS domain S-box-containing protein
MSDWQLKQLWELIEFGEKKFCMDERREFPLIHVDDNFCQMLGYDQQEIFLLCRNKARELIHFTDVKSACEIIETGIKERGRYSCRYRMRKKNGELIWVWDSGNLITTKDGESYVRSIVVNITNEESFRKERDATYDVIPGGVLSLLVTDSNFYITEANRQCVEMMGTTRDDYLGTSGIFTFPEDLPGLKKHIITQANKKEPIDYEFRTYSEDEEGNVCWRRVIGRYFNEAEDGSEYLAIMTDVSERRKMLYQLESEKEHYRVAIGLMSSFLFEYTLATKHLQVFSEDRSSANIPVIRNEVMGEWEDILSQSNFVYKEDCQKAIELLKSERTEHMRVRLLTQNRKTGKRSYQWYDVEAQKILEGGKITRVMGSARNVQKQQDRKEEIREMREIYQIQMTKIFEVILKIRISDGHMKSYFWPDESIKPDFPGNSFISFVSDMGENYVHPEDRETYLRAMELSHMQDVLTSKLVETLYFRMRRDTDDYRYKCIQYCYLDDEKTEIMMYSQDVDQIRSEQIMADEAKDRILADNISDVQEVMEMKRNFSTMLARELIGPLRYIRSAIQGKISSDDEIMDALGYISGVVDNISEYERMERGQIEFETNRFALDEMLNKCFLSWSRKAKEFGIDIRYNINLQWRNYYGDEMRLVQLLDHMIGNSVMASEKGDTVEIWISDVAQGGGANRLIIMVEDWGIPVNDGYFGRDYPMDLHSSEADWKKNINKIGTAFSLVVARKLVSLLGGRMKISRKGDVSNVLQAELILQKNADSPIDMKIPNEEENPENDKILEGYSLLLVRNKEGERKLSGAVLQLRGARADVAAGGVEALKLLKTYRNNVPDAILVEENLGDMDCLEFAEQFRKLKCSAAKTVLIIGIVDEVSQEIIQAGMKIGINGWLDDPSDLKRLHLMLEMRRADKIKMVQ